MIPYTKKQLLDAALKEREACLNMAEIAQDAEHQRDDLLEENKRLREALQALTARVNAVLGEPKPRAQDLFRIGDRVQLKEPDLAKRWLLRGTVCGFLENGEVEVRRPKLDQLALLFSGGGDPLPYWTALPEDIERA